MGYYTKSQNFCVSLTLHFQIPIFQEFLKLQTYKNYRISRFLYFQKSGNLEVQEFLKSGKSGKFQINKLCIFVGINVYICS